MAGQDSLVSRVKLDCENDQKVEMLAYERDYAYRYSTNVNNRRLMDPDVVGTLQKFKAENDKLSENNSRLKEELAMLKSRTRGNYNFQAPNRIYA